MDQIEVQWPNGTEERVGTSEAGQFLTLQEGRRIIRSERFR